MRFITLWFLILGFSLSAWAGLKEAEALKERIQLRFSAIAKRKVEEIRLPVSRGFDQKDSQLCWVHSFLNAQETMFLIKNPGKKLELSRSFFQYHNLKDRMTRIIQLDDEFLSERGTPLDALALARANGLVRFTDYVELLRGVNSRYSSVARSIRRADGISAKEAVLAEKLQSIFPAIPAGDGKLTSEVLGDSEWTAYAPGDEEGWGIHPDSDARKGQRAYYMSMDKIVAHIREALRAGIPVTYGGNGHSVMIYGADYDEDGRPVRYYIKDSYPDYFYTAAPRSLHEALLEVSLKTR